MATLCNPLERNEIPGSPGSGFGTALAKQSCFKKAFVAFPRLKKAAA